MTRGSLLSWLPPLGSLLLLGACVEPPARADAQADAHPAKQESAHEAVTPTPTPPATPPAPTQPAFAPVKPTPAGPLTAEEERLIAADINTLSTEEKRLRAYAQRKKIMQNPDSEAAKALLEAQQALMAGEILEILADDVENLCRARQVVGEGLVDLAHRADEVGEGAVAGGRGQLRQGVLDLRGL